MWSPPGLFVAVLRSQNSSYSLERSMVLFAWVFLLSLFFDLCSEERALAGNKWRRERSTLLRVPTEVVQ